MASVSNLDQDVKNLRLSRYTPAAANEARAWIEDTLGEKLASGDLLEALKDGIALCKLANLALPPPGIKYKTSSMPFVQMENISHFLRACESAPLFLPAHDRFLTVDLYESKDPAQVLQCLGAFSRVANAVSPDKFRSSIGPRRGTVSGLAPNVTGGSAGRQSPTRNGFASSTGPGASRAMSPSLTGGSNASAGRGLTASPSAPVTSWSKKSDQGTTAPAWNIAQYGYMGGASQGNQGVAFGARRQITSAAPHVPSLAEKERRRREAEQEQVRLREEAEAAEHKRQVERAAEEEREQAEEERRWQEETQRKREEERAEVERQKRQWEEDEKRWREAEIARQEEEKLEAERLQREKSTSVAPANSSILRGQTLSEYKRETRSQAGSRQTSSTFASVPSQSAESDRVKELERQLEEAKRREAEYERGREERRRGQVTATAKQTVAAGEAKDIPADSPKESQTSWAGDEHEHLRAQHRAVSGSHDPVRPLPDPQTSRPLPKAPQPDLKSGPPSNLSSSQPEPRPLPVPESTTSSNTTTTAPTVNRTDRFLATNAPPATPSPSITTAPDATISTSGEQAAETSRRLLSQQKTKAGGWASKSLLEREMERERERQREWEEGQKEKAAAAAAAKGGTAGGEGTVGPAGEAWDVNQYGYLGGDSQNRGAVGIGFGGRRQIIGPRPQK